MEGARLILRRRREPREACRTAATARPPASDAFDSYFTCLISKQVHGITRICERSATLKLPAEDCATLVIGVAKTIELNHPYFYSILRKGHDARYGAERASKQ